MRILHIAAGAGGMYCGACARDIGLILGLRARGHEVHVVPLYTPLRIDVDDPTPIAPVFLGGINLSLQQRFALFRRIPPALDRILDNTALLRFVSRFAINTRASDLGEMAVAVLSGTSGPFRKESDRLLSYLERHDPPDIIVITNTMLSGLAPTLKQKYGVPIVAQVQGEDGFVGAMPEPHTSRARKLMCENARSVDLFVSPNGSYAAEMVEYLEIPAYAMRVVRTGLAAEMYAHDGPRAREPFTTGYLSGIAHGKGLDLLVDAWRQLVEGQGRDVRLLVAGRVLDTDYWRKVKRGIEAETLAGKFEYAGELEFHNKVRFLRRCSAFCVPSRQSEPRGLAMMEAMASGVPLVAPAAGVFPEMLSLAEGGIMFRPGDPDDLALKLAQVMDGPDAADHMGRQGAEGVTKHYAPDLAADGMAAALEEALAKAGGGG